MSSVCRLRRALVHLDRFCRLRRYFFQRSQNSFVRCCTIRQRLSRYTSSLWNMPGGGNTGLVFMVRTWIGDKGDGEVRSPRLLTVRGRQFTMASASQMNVWKDSSLRRFPFFSIKADSTLRRVLICRSHTPPAWLAEGTLVLYSNQSQLFHESSWWWGWQGGSSWVGSLGTSLSVEDCFFWSDLQLSEDHCGRERGPIGAVNLLSCLLSFS